MEISLTAVLQAISRATTHIRWKPEKAHPHLRKRIRKGHLPMGATLEEYEQLIENSLKDPDADLYVYTFNETEYPTIVSYVDNEYWLVMITMDGLMETAFPPSDPNTYLSNPRFIYQGTVRELLS